jgi:hypothetical protein
MVLFQKKSEPTYYISILYVPKSPKPLRTMHACMHALWFWINAFVGHAVCRKWPTDWRNPSRPIEKPTGRLAIWHVRINFDTSSMVARGTEISVGPLGVHLFQTEQGRTRPHFLSVGLLISFFIIFFFSLRVRACASFLVATNTDGWCRRFSLKHETARQVPPRGG